MTEEHKSNSSPEQQIFMNDTSEQSFYQEYVSSPAHAEANKSVEDPKTPAGAVGTIHHRGVDLLRLTPIPSRDLISRLSTSGPGPRPARRSLVHSPLARPSTSTARSVPTLTMSELESNSEEEYPAPPELSVRLEPGLGSTLKTPGKEIPQREEFDLDDPPELKSFADIPSDQSQQLDNTVAHSVQVTTNTETKTTQRSSISSSTRRTRRRSSSFGGGEWAKPQRLSGTFELGSENGMVLPEEEEEEQEGDFVTPSRRELGKPRRVIQTPSSAIKKLIFPSSPADLVDTKTPSTTTVRPTTIPEDPSHTEDKSSTFLSDQEAELERLEERYNNEHLLRMAQESDKLKIEREQLEQREAQRLELRRIELEEREARERARRERLRRERDERLKLKRELREQAKEVSEREKVNKKIEPQERKKRTSALFDQKSVEKEYSRISIENLEEDDGEEKKFNIVTEHEKEEQIHPKVNISNGEIHGEQDKENETEISQQESDYDINQPQHEHGSPITNDSSVPTSAFQTQKENDNLQQARERLRTQTEELERLQKEEIERLQREEMDRVKQEELDRIRKQELARIRKEELERIRKEELERIRKEELERIRKEELDRVREEERDRLRKEERKKLQAELARVEKAELDRQRQVLAVQHEKQIQKERESLDLERAQIERERASIEAERAQFLHRLETERLEQEKKIREEKEEDERLEAQRLERVRIQHEERERLEHEKQVKEDMGHARERHEQEREERLRRRHNGVEPSPVRSNHSRSSSFEINNRVYPDLESSILPKRFNTVVKERSTTDTSVNLPVNGSLKRPRPFINPELFESPAKKVRTFSVYTSQTSSVWTPENWTELFRSLKRTYPDMLRPTKSQTLPYVPLTLREQFPEFSESELARRILAIRRQLR